jgi:arsenite oxidase large subunit
MPEIQPVPLPPLGAEEISTACDYCVVGCSYRVWRWKVGAGGTANTAVPWANPSQHNIVQWQGEPHHVLVLPDPQARAVNPMGNHSMRGGTLAQKCYNPENKTRERLTTPLLRVKGELQPVSWDTALDIMAAVSKHVLKNHGEHAWGVKAYSYQYFENTYAITRLALDAIGTPAFAPHDKCANGNDAAGLDDAGLEAFAPAYEDWGACDVLFMSGTDPFETKSTLFTSWIMRGGAPNKTLIFATPHRSMGVAWAEQRGGLWLPVIPGTDTLLHNAIARVIVERGWQDQAFIERWVAKRWEVDQGYGRGTRNTPWQWRTTWGTWQSDWEDFRQFLMSRDEHRPEHAARITGVSAALIERAAELLAKPHADGTRPKASFMLEKGNYWSNNYMNSASFAALGLVCGAEGFFLGEMAVTRYPDLDLSGAVPYLLNNYTLPDKTSWGYVAEFGLTYANIFQSGWTMSPILDFYHDVQGTSPTALPFVEGRKAVALNLNFDYHNEWKAGIGYVTYWGGGNMNMLRDRDVVTMSVSRTF